MARESLRYLQNAQEILRKSPVEENQYIDNKYVRSACGVAYLGVIRGIDDYLLSRGVSRKDLPKKVEEYRKALMKYAAPHNGKLLRQFDNIYDELHIAGYYRGFLHTTEAVKAAFRSARDFIEKLK